MKCFFSLMIWFFCINQLSSQENAIYSLKINYSYKSVIDCEGCATNSKNYGHLGLDNGNGSPFFQLYTTEDVSIDLAFWETWTYDSSDGWNTVNYCFPNVSSGFDEFINMNVNYCEARRNVETTSLSLGNSVEYGNVNSENLGSINAGSYVKAWMLPYEPEGDIISVGYCENIFDREGVQVEDGFWEYYDNANQEWIPIENENYKSLYPLNISVEELDEIVPGNLEILGNIQLRFTLFASGSGSWTLWDMEFDDNPSPTITPGYKERNFLYVVEFNSCGIELDSDILENPEPIPVECNGGSDGGAIIFFERQLEEGETLVINLKVDSNNDGNFNEEPIFGTDPPLTASDFNGFSYTIQNQLESGNYQMEWGLSNDNDEALWSGPVEFHIPESLPIAFDLNKTDITCSGASDGEIVVANLNGGNGNYSFTWLKEGEFFDLPEGSTNMHLVNLPFGTYSLLVTDGNGCESSVQEIELIAEAQSPQLNSFALFQAGQSPNFLPTGSIVLQQVTGGDGDYVFNWTKNDQPFAPNDPQSLMALEPADYSVIITDNNGQGCSSVEYSFVIHELLPIEVSISEQVSINCEGDLGILEVNVSGGTNGGYEFLWSTGDITESINVGQGSYSITVTDNANNVEEANYEFDYENPLLNVEAVQNNSICKGEDFGSIQLNISGGTGGPYEVSWLDSPTSDSLRDNLPIGKYIFFVSDGECIVTNENNPIVLTEPDIGIEVTEISKADISINGAEDGEITINVQNGVPPFTYGWTKDEEPFVLSPQSTENQLTGLGEGNYQVVVTDANGCSASLEEPIHIFEPEPLEIVELIPVHISCKGGASGSITANVTGIPPFSYVWEKLGQVTFSAPNAATITGLTAGTYSLRLTDNSLVSEVIDTVVLTEPSQELGSTMLPHPKECFVGDEGTIEITAFGGTPPYFYSIDDGLNFQGSSTFLNLLAGTYDLIIKDSGNCELMKTTTVGLPDQIKAEFALASQTFVNETIVAVDLSYPAPETVEWTVPEGVLVLEQNNNVLELIFPSPGEYEVTMTSFKDNCWSKRNKKIVVLERDGLIHEKIEVDNKVNHVEEFVVYPNPTSGEFNAVVQLSSSGNINLRTFGFANNNLILQRQVGGSKSYDVPLNIEGLTSGIYILVLETPFGNSLRKVILR